MYSLLFMCWFSSFLTLHAKHIHNNYKAVIFDVNNGEPTVDWLLVHHDAKQQHRSAATKKNGLGMRQNFVFKNAEGYDRRRSVFSKDFYPNEEIGQEIAIPRTFKVHRLKKRNISELSGRFCAFGKIKLNNGKCIPCVKYLDSEDGSCESEVFKTVCPIQWQVICI